jgi:hypothetical protein
MLMLKRSGKYYYGYDGVKPSDGAKGRAPRFDAERAKMILKQLTDLGFHYQIVDQFKTDEEVRP